MRGISSFVLVVAVIGSGCGSGTETPPASQPPSTRPSAAKPSATGPEAVSPPVAAAPAETPKGSLPEVDSSRGTTPEAALRNLFGAMLASDRAGVLANALPNPEIELLLSPEPLTPEQIAQAQAQFDAMPVHALSVGDSISLPGGETLVFDETMINDDHQMLTIPGSDLPLELVRIDGAWKVNASPLIAARKAAQAARAQHAARGAQDGTVADGPERALRTFLGAMLLGDREGVVSSALEHPEIDILLSSDLTSPEQRAAVKAQVDAMPVTVLAVGDEVAFPDGHTVVADATMINDGKQLLTFPGNPVPFEVVRVNGVWKVNAAPIIEARKAARAARK